MANLKYVQDNCRKMYALSYLVNDLFKDTSLVDRIEDDVKDIIQKKTAKKEAIVTKYTEESDSQKANLIRTLDGHIVKSDGERQIDDILFINRIVHVYEKDVLEIDVGERTLKSDWFIPGSNGRSGVYIEYWGMKTKDYLKNKEEKKKLYKENNVCLIEVEMDDINDIQGLTNRIIKELRRLDKDFKLQISGL